MTPTGDYTIVQINGMAASMLNLEDRRNMDSLGIIAYRTYTWGCGNTCVLAVSRASAHKILSVFRAAAEHFRGPKAPKSYNNRRAYCLNAISSIECCLERDQEKEATSRKGCP